MLIFNRIFTARSKIWTLLLYSALLITTFSYVDKPLAEWCHRLDWPICFAVLNGFTHLGLNSFYLAGFLLAALFFRYGYHHKNHEQRCWFLWCCVLLSTAICGVLKVLLGRARPELWFAHHDYGFYGWQTTSPFWSCPSGHTTTIMVIALALAIIWPRYKYLYLTLGLLMALSRVLLTYHYLSDVLFASYLSLVELNILLWFWRRKSIGLLETSFKA